ncbi:hypothetical protein CGMCC3_g8430 [Colletotrichum fructicola]|nr:uncharacterized protein CGMCC3_g8430 [Colletotrichum fructicola]KAE9575501.1 hypothetical protein CGMCC3_g8430 [Colletotrichum fructicola]
MRIHGTTSRSRERKARQGHIGELEATGKEKLDMELGVALTHHHGGSGPPGYPGRRFECDDQTSLTVSKELPSVPRSSLFKSSDSSHPKSSEDSPPDRRARLAEEARTSPSASRFRLAVPSTSDTGVIS